MTGELCEDEGCPHHGTPHVCLNLFDPDRESRVHVVNARFRKDLFYVVLSGGMEVEWSLWISLPQDERRNM